MTRVSLSDVTVRYPIYASSRHRSLLSFAANRASFGRVARDVGKVPVVEALRGISIELKEGDRLAVVGRNGSGKTTLLKLCAGLLLPDIGRCEIVGSRAAIINPGAAVDIDKTGAENVEVIGRLLGVRRSQRKILLDDVVAFTELGDFINLPVRSYSSGMLVRLLFALGTSAERDILVVDEVIGAGDLHFVEKAAKRVQQLFARTKILILATHSASIAEQLCTSALWLDGGRPMMIGAPSEVWDAYKVQRPPLDAVA
ncbi:MAG: ATP-binding cassette domain-containing protein [Hyphomonadaceae bacterium]|nr:ATP-binding cassette domain-containing protein [Hyphomonadaceae bacterium]